MPRMSHTIHGCLKVVVFMKPSLLLQGMNVRPRRTAPRDLKGPSALVLGKTVHSVAALLVREVRADHPGQTETAGAVCQAERMNLQGEREEIGFLSHAQTPQKNVIGNVPLNSTVINSRRLNCNAVTFMV